MIASRTGFARGERVEAGEALELYRRAPTPLLGRLADEVRARKHPDGIVTYIIDRNVNYTNVCVAKCNFCAFYRPVGSSEGYVLGFDELFRKIDETIAVGGVQLLLQGGHNPDLPLDVVQRSLPRGQGALSGLQAACAVAARGDSSVAAVAAAGAGVLDRLIAAGLDSVPAAAPRFSSIASAGCCTATARRRADEWLDVMRHAHRAGLRTTATMMYGTVETDEERLEHLLRLRALQDETGGFTAFITWSYQPDHTELAGSEATGIDYLRTLAIARLVLDNFDNLQASWVTQGGKVGQLSLAYGANDMGSVMIEENVVRAAGASYCMDEAEIVRNIEDAGFRAKRRNMHYEILGDPIFREREVPRMLELATARADGDTTCRRSCVCIRRAAAPKRNARRIDPLPRLLDSADRRAADSRRVGCRRWRPHCRHRAAADRVPRDGRDVDLGAVAVLPGLVNAHTHLELSYLRDEVPPAARFVELDPSCDGREAQAARSGRGRDHGGVEEGIAEAVAFGTAIVGDISNTLVTVPALVAKPPRRGRVLRADRVQAGGRRTRSSTMRCGASARVEPTDRVRVGLAAHAPYSVAPQRAARDARGCRNGVIRSVQRAPVGVGRRGRVHSDRRRPVARAARGGRVVESGLGGSRCLAGAVSRRDRLSDVRSAGGARRADDPRRPAAARARVARRSSRVRAATGHTGAGTPPIAEFYASGVRVAVGTDSLASTPDLNVFAELAAMRALAPDGSGVRAARERDAAWRRRARVRRRLRHDCSRESARG